MPIIKLKGIETSAGSRKSIEIIAKMEMATVLIFFISSLENKGFCDGLDGNEWEWIGDVIMNLKLLNSY